MKPKKLRGTTAWMLFSDAGYPVFFPGVFSFAGQLRDAYAGQFGHTPEKGGYRISRVRIEPAQRRKAGPA